MPRTNETKNVNRLSLKDHRKFTELLINIGVKHQLLKKSFQRDFASNWDRTCSNF